MTKALDAAGAPPMTADRDAELRKIADELVDKLGYCIGRYGVPIELADAIRAAIPSIENQASELAALRRRVAQMETVYEALYHQLHEIVERFNARRASGAQGAFSDIEMLPARQALHTYRDLGPALSPSPPAEERESGT